MTSYDLTARRRFGREEKAAIVAEALREKSVSAVARRHGIAAALLFRWKKDLTESAASAEPAPGTPAQSLARFVPATLASIEAERAPQRPEPAAAVPDSAGVEITFADGAVLKAPAGVAESTLVRLVAALKA